MKSLNNCIIIPVVFFTSMTWAQLTVAPLHYMHRIDNTDLYMHNSQDLHSGILPLLTTGEMHFEKTAGQLVVNKDSSFIPDHKNQYGASFRLYPVADIGAGAEYRPNDDNYLKYTAGAGLGIDFRSKKIFFTGKLMPYVAASSYVGDSIQQKFNMDLGTTREIADNVYSRNELLLAYRPNKFFTFIGGYGKNFFGEGYRSLLLSDNASNYPFLKLETTFWSIKYVNLYTIWNNNTIQPADKSFDRMKFSAMHYLSWNITKEFNLSIFESVIWQNQDTLANRGFDLNYLNPVVFYRPVEYASGSADNVLLGANLSYKINAAHCIYSQVILDEFLLSRIKDGSKWWGNKWGLQIGYKSSDFVINNLYFQTEFNVVRPFTYSHKYAVQNYGHLNASVTHPIGANFYELLNIVSYNKEKVRITNKLTFSCYGIDTDTINNGQDIFKSYADRDGEEGHLIMQGLRTNVLNEQIIFEMPLVKNIDLYFNVTYNYRMHFTPLETQHQHFIFAGIRSRIWNVYNDI